MNPRTEPYLDAFLREQAGEFSCQHYSLKRKIGRPMLEPLIVDDRVFSRSDVKVYEVAMAKNESEQLLSEIRLIAQGRASVQRLYWKYDAKKRLLDVDFFAPDIEPQDHQELILAALSEGEQTELFCQLSCHATWLPEEHYVLRGYNQEVVTHES